MTADPCIPCEICAPAAAIWEAAPIWACDTAPVSDKAGRDQGHRSHLWDRAGITVRCRGYRQPQRPVDFTPPSNDDDPSGERADLAAERMADREPPTHNQPRVLRVTSRRPA